MRRILHLDMDAFYAAVELRRRPELRGRPVVIGGRDPARRGVVSTATYEARAFGVRSAMPLRTAHRLCPGCVFLPADFPEYQRWSKVFKAEMLKTSPRLEDHGIDEAFLDLSGLADPVAAARELKARIVAATGGMTCSVGLAPNKLLAKLASELDKPDGLTVLEAQHVPARIWPLPVRRLQGVGPRAEARLARLGIDTVGMLAATPLETLRRHFGEAWGRHLHDSAHGRDDRPVAVHREPKSRSRERTFQEDLGDFESIAENVALLAEQVAADLRAKGHVGRGIGLKLRYADFETLTRDRRLAVPTADEAPIRRTALELLGRVRLDRKVRLLGVRVFDLYPGIR